MAPYHTAAELHDLGGFNRSESGSAPGEKLFRASPPFRSCIKPSVDRADFRSGSAAHFRPLSGGVCCAPRSDRLERGEREARTNPVIP